MTEQCPRLATGDNPRRHKIARLSHVEDFLINAVLQSQGTASAAAVASALGSVLDEYHNEIVAYIGELTLAARAEKATEKGD
jgi:hypothetical protein